MIINISIGPNAYNLVLLYGDEQFVSWLLTILRGHQSFYGNILPFPGIRYILLYRMMKL
jgi:hypothetical protein